ncbi:uncharacterized protein LOC109789016 [Cajanus cajan]|uniref:uncharacterized protein LOC109789016 n=1 Tax=Cajanus cajan TaxID=3821 RepID=UPI00098DB9AE|nr:uncharacterized protein LOC109789016 [Cajanus cajan]
MDRSWVNARRIIDEYQNGVEQFLELAQRNQADLNGKFYCPCVNCLNGRRHVIDEIRDHLICDGFLTSYTTWIWHGEDKETQIVAQTEQDDVEMEDQIEDMIRDVGQEFFQQAQSHVYDTLKSDSETPLFPDCTTYTRLSAVLRLMNLKEKYGWSDKSFTEFLEVLKLMLPKDNTLPDRHYEAKKVLCPMGLQYKKIHACPNDCILYRKEFESLQKCPRCGLSRYKVKDDGRSSDEDVVEKGPPAKVLWYLPIIPRFKRLFANATDAMNLTWHADKRNCDGMLRHPTNSPQWKKIDGLFPNFGSEARNLRLGLASDGMNPFGNLSTNHSSWPVLFSIYNFPPWLCMKRKYVILCMMIAGPKQSGNDIDVYLSPLIKDFRILWEEGVDVFDGYRQQSFNLHAMIFCTINDFPAYGNLSGYSVKGHHACPICEKQTSYL